MNKNYKKAITKVQAAIIAVVLIIVIIIGVYAYFTILAPPKVEMKVAAWGSFAVAMKDLASKFMEKYPGIKIEVVTYDWDTMREKLFYDISVKGGEFEIYFWDCIWTGTFAPHVYTWDELKSKYPDAEILTKSDYDDLIPTIDRQYAFWEGKRIGVVYAANVMPLFYRKDLIENPSIKEHYKKWVSEHMSELTSLIAKFGLKEEIPKEMKVPETLTDFLVIGRYFTKSINPDSPVDYGVAIVGKRTHVIFWQYLPFFAVWRTTSEGIKKFGEVKMPWGHYFTADGKPAFDPALGNEGIQALEYYKEITKYAPSPYEADYPEALEAFGKGKAALLPLWASAGIELIDQAEKYHPEVAGKVAATKHPGGLGCDGTWQIGVSKYAKHPKEAWMFIQFCTLADSQKVSWEVGQVFPSRASVIKALAPKYPYMNALYEQLLHPAVRTYIPPEPELDDALVKWVSEFFIGRIDAKTALENTVKDWNEILKRTGWA